MPRELSLPPPRLLLLFIGGLAGVFAVLPHPGSHLGEFLADAVLIGLATGAGTYLAPCTVLQSPVLDAALAGRPFARRGLALAAQALGVGVVTTLLLLALDTTLFAPRLAAAPAAPPLWTGALYALAGGLSEEVVFHYGLLAVLAWAAQRVLPATRAYWLAITVTALALGVFHFASTAAVLSLTPLVAMRTLVLSALGGVATGWLYWRRGLEAAMLAHAVVSFALHVAAPGVFG